MPHKRIFGLLFFLPAFVACYHNPVFPARVGHIHRVVILGNSIVSQPPIPERGWNHDWGMAASAAQKDFVHLLTYAIHSRHPDVYIVYQTIGAFERQYRTFDWHRLDSLRGADLYIVKLAENVPDTATDFIPYYDKLISYLDTTGGVNVIMDGFWSNPINRPLAHYARDHHYPFIHISDLSGDTTMEARGLFLDRGVSVHPSDKGMQAIADRIWNYIDVYF